ncbi:MAG: hypothetical protein DMF53_25850 [Acidobacteria bacterium]|nr:MAG: hypothetical protein DMF53_25850 [Acidobacteriota bacterium]
MQDIGRKHLPGVATVLGILLQQNDLVSSADVVVVRRVPQIGTQQHQRISVAVGILHRLAKLSLGTSDFQLP